MLGVVIYNILDKEPHGHHIKALFVTFKIPCQLAAEVLLDGLANIHFLM